MDFICADSFDRSVVTTALGTCLQVRCHLTPFLTLFSLVWTFRGRLRIDSTTRRCARPNNRYVAPHGQDRVNSHPITDSRNRARCPYDWSQPHALGGDRVGVAAAARRSYRTLWSRFVLLRHATHRQNMGAKTSQSLPHAYSTGIDVVHYLCTLIDRVGDCLLGCMPPTGSPWVLLRYVCLRDLSDAQDVHPGDLFAVLGTRSFFVPGRRCGSTGCILVCFNQHHKASQQTQQPVGRWRHH